jgi:hypothetical protein
MEQVAKQGASYFVLIFKYYWADQIKKNVVGETCITRGRGAGSVQGSGGKVRKKDTTHKT